jgi:hypothetical protein
MYQKGSLADWLRVASKVTIRRHGSEVAHSYELDSRLASAARSARLRCNRGHRDKKGGAFPAVADSWSNP